MLLELTDRASQVTEIAEELWRLVSSSRVRVGSQATNSRSSSRPLATSRALMHCEDTPDSSASYFCTTC